MRLLLVVSLLCTPLSALAGTGEWYDLHASVPSPAVALVTPSGTGPTLAEQGIRVEVDYEDWHGATTTIVIARDSILLSGADPDDTFVLCTNGVAADADTDPNGHTTISGRIAGGGYTRRGVIVQGETRDRHLVVRLESELVALRLNSPDINGDLAIDLYDLNILARDYGSSEFRSDLRYDGVVDFQDFIVLAQHAFTQCP
jgi:hypothetical protein